MEEVEELYEQGSLISRESHQKLKAFIEEASKTSHVEVTCLIVPGMNDDREQMLRMSEWLASISEDLPLHVSRFHPCFHMTDRPPTPVDTVYELADAARSHLKYVYTGNC